MKSVLFKTLVMPLTLSLVLAVPAASVFAAADAYPSKPIRLIVPVAPGGSRDIVGRLIATKLTERLGKQVIVENHGGAGGVLGSEMAAKAAPDGYTLLIINVAHGMNPAFYKLPYDSIKSFTPVAKLLNGPNVLAVHQSVPANSVKELIALAKQKPGQLITVASGIGSSSHLAAELFKKMAGIDFKIVQFKGAGPALIDMLGGHSHFIITSILPVLPHIKSGQLRVLGDGGVKRSVILPDVPTIAEAGLAGYDVSGWFGVLAPTGTPRPVIDRLNKEIKTILSSAELQKRFVNEGTEVDYMAPAEFGPFLEREVTKWVRVVKEANIKVE
jgi:tripartite-type tricarboxylate transporter receptor subunit TctC